jgi:hypothetical protein
MTLEGLWRVAGVVDEPSGTLLEFEAVGRYEAVPLPVWQGLLSLSPWRGRYDNAEAEAVVRAMWRHAHPAAPLQAAQPRPPPQPAPLVAPPPSAAAAAAAPQHARAPLAGRGAPLPSMLASRHALTSSMVPAHAAAPAAGAATAAAAPAGPPAPAAAPAVAPAAGPATAAAVTPSSALADTPAGASVSGPGQQGSPAAAAAAAPAAYLKTCPVCNSAPGGWLVISCKHMGPCWKCLPSDPATRQVTSPPEYLKCLRCGKPTGQLLKVRG